MYRFLLICLTMFIVNVHASAEKTWVFSFDVIRHGDRTPLSIIPTAPHTWPEGIGQLTAKGMEQEYQLGRNFRQRYIKNTRLLPAHYDPKTILVYSTDVERTLVSARALLLGLYPAGTGPQLDLMTEMIPFVYQSIPINIGPQNSKDLPLAVNDKFYFKRLLEQHVIPLSAWQEKSKQLAPMFPKWSKITGVPVHSLEDLPALADVLYIYQLYQIPYPKGLSDVEAKKIIEAGRWVFMNSVAPQEVGKALGRPFTATIANYIKQATGKNTSLKLVIFLAHDSTLLSIMSAMQTPIMDTSPPYASDLNFSVFRTEKNQYLVNITFNGKPVIPPTCGGYDCPLTKFLKLIEN